MIERCVVVLAAVLGVLLGGVVFGQDVTYQGRLEENGQAFDGTVDVQADVYDAETGGTPVSSGQEVSGVVVSEGLFTVELPFSGNAFEPGEARWLEIRVRRSGQATFEVLTPRQRVAEVPVANEAERAEYAETGPFEPLDSTAESHSGIRGAGALLVELRSLGGSLERVTLAAPIEVELPNGNPSGLFPVLVRRVWDPSRTDWRDSMMQGFDRNDLEILCVSPGTAQARWVLTGGVISAHRYERSANGGVFEVAELVFPKTNIVRAFVDEGMLMPPLRPQLAGVRGADSTPESGTILYEWGGAVPALTIAGGVADERIPLGAGGVPTGSLQSADVTMVSGVLRDNSLWDDFMTVRNRPLRCFFESQRGGTQQLPNPDTNQAVIHTWRLEIADDGLPVEVYTVEYMP